MHRAIRTRRLRVIHPDHDHAAPGEFLIDLTQCRRRSCAEGAGVRPEAEEDHLSAQIREAERRRIEPDRVLPLRRGFAEHVSTGARPRHPMLRGLAGTRRAFSGYRVLFRSRLAADEPKQSDREYADRNCSEPWTGIMIHGPSIPVPPHLHHLPRCITRRPAVLLLTLLFYTALHLAEAFLAEKASSAFELPKGHEERSAA